MKAALIAALIALPVFATAKPQCYVNPTTDAYTCYDKVKERDGIRYADMYSGGPRGVQPTGFQFAVNCSTGVMHLKDRQGVSFAGSDSGTPAGRALKRWICEESLGKQK